MAMTKTKRRKRVTAPGAVDPGALFMQMMKDQLKNERDQRSHAAYLAEMRAKQAAGRLANPATAALLDRLERTIR